MSITESKKGGIQTKFKQVIKLSTVRLVRSGKVSSASKRRRATSIARSVGMFMNNETTSKEANTSFSLKVLEDTNSAKSLEFRTADGESPTSGDRVFERCFDSWYVGELIKDTIGCKGMPDL